MITDIKTETINLSFTGEIRPYEVTFNADITSWYESDFAYGHWINTEQININPKIFSIEYVEEEGPDTYYTDNEKAFQEVLNYLNDQDDEFFIN